MVQKKIAVLGGGASGMMAAIVAAKSGADVTIIEHKDRVGKKILMTGNGKCNLTNLHMNKNFYYSHNLEKAMQIMERFKPEDTIAFFNSLGLMTKEKRDGGIYPVAEQASVVLDVLRASCEQLHIKTVLYCQVEDIKPGKVITLSGKEQIPVDVPVKNAKKGKEKIAKEFVTKKYEASFDTLILACGGCAASVSGSDGSGYAYAKLLGCKLYKTVPALVQLYGVGDYFKSIAGVRCEASLKLFVENQQVAEEYGELQLTDYGISGIPVFQFSRIAALALSEKKKCLVEIDFFPYHSEPLKWDTYENLTAEVFLEGYLNKKLCALLLKRAGVSLEQKVGTISKKSRNRIFTELHHFIIPIEKANSFDHAQVSAGGVSLDEVDDNLCLKKYPNISIVGELLDVDGKCGGYNLQWAWATGYIAGNAAFKIKE